MQHSERLQSNCRSLEEAVDRLRDEQETQRVAYDEKLQKKDVEVDFFLTLLEHLGYSRPLSDFTGTSRL